MGCCKLPNGDTVEVQKETGHEEVTGANWQTGELAPDGHSRGNALFGVRRKSVTSWTVTANYLREHP